MALSETAVAIAWQWSSGAIMEFPAFSLLSALSTQRSTRGPKALGNSAQATAEGCDFLASRSERPEDTYFVSHLPLGS